MVSSVLDSFTSGAHLLESNSRRCAIKHAQAFLLIAVWCLCIAVLCRAEEVERHQWLRLSYFETNGHASFGAYPVELASTPALYWTQGAVENAVLNGIPVVGSGRVLRWLEGLMEADGVFDDPLDNAPPLIETWWALRTLRFLGADLERFAATKSFLVRRLSSLTFGGGVSTELVSTLNEAHIIAACLEEFAAAGCSVDESSLQAFVDRLTEARVWMRGVLAATASWAVGDQRHEAAWAFTLTLARMAPAHLSADEQLFLMRHLNEAEAAPPSFVGCALLRDLLIAGRSAFGWQNPPPEIAALIGCYLENSILSSLSSMGGLGFAVHGRVWIDAQMTSPLVCVYSLLGQSYPMAAELDQSFARLRIENGWVQQVQFMPDSETTFYGLQIARQSQWSDHSEAKILEYFHSVLQASSSSVSDVLYAVRGILALGGRPADLESKVISIFSNRGEEWIAGLFPAVVELLSELSIDPRRVGLDLLLEERRIALLEALEVLVRMSFLWELAMLDDLLFTCSLTPESLKDHVLALLSVDGGFNFQSVYPTQVDMPSPIPTCMAIEILLNLGMEGAIPRGPLPAFLDRCRLGPGYLLAPRDVLQLTGDPAWIDFESTYYGLRVELFAQTGGL